MTFALATFGGKVTHQILVSVAKNIVSGCLIVFEIKLGTLEDSDKLECLILDISPDADLDELFRPLENSRYDERLLSKEKARIQNRPHHASWLRIYAIKLEPGKYIVTGGAIKLTATMQEREHTLRELHNMEKVRQFLVANQVIDEDAFVDYLKEL